MGAQGYLLRAGIHRIHGDNWRRLTTTGVACVVARTFAAEPAFADYAGLSCAVGLGVLDRDRRQCTQPAGQRLEIDRVLLACRSDFEHHWVPTQMQGDQLVQPQPDELVAYIISLFARAVAVGHPPSGRPHRRGTWGR